MTGTIITISSNSWLGAWIGLEINLLSFIPLISDNNRNNLISTEASLKYFLIQAIASTVLLFAVIIILLESAIIINLIIYSKSIILSSLLLKRGTAPFHFWFPNVMEGISWINALILMTWQKIAPIILISYVLIYPLLRFRIILSVIIGSLGGLNQTSIRKLMAFSSINHLGWILAAIIYRESLWLIYLLIYSTLLINLTLLFNIFKISHINQLFSLFFKNNNLKFILSINLLSLGGLPPFLGFLPKWLVIQANVLNSSGYWRESLKLRNVPIKEGLFAVYRRNYTDDKEISATYTTFSDDGDVVEDRFIVLESQNNFIEIENVDLSSMEMNGNLQITIVRDSLDPIDNPSLADTIFFADGVFRLKIIE